MSSPLPNSLATPLAVWVESWRHADALSRAGMESFALICDPRRIRNQWLATLTNVTDICMRSPLFLELMKHNLKATAQLSQIISIFFLNRRPPR